MKADYILAIDPGLHGCGATFGIRGTIKRAAYVRGNPDTKASIPDLWYEMAAAVLAWDQDNNFEHQKSLSTELVIECPQVYKASHQRGGKEKTDPQDIVNLAGCVGAIVALLTGYYSPRIYLPREWKGQVPKEICHARAIKALTPDELVIVNAGCTPKSLAHNVLDSVAMYLKHSGRVS
jgi:hypothetical protein